MLPADSAPAETQPAAGPTAPVGMSPIGIDPRADRPDGSGPPARAAVQVAPPGGREGSGSERESRRVRRQRAGPST